MYFVQKPIAEDKFASNNSGIKDGAYFKQVLSLGPKILPGETGIPFMSIAVKII